MDETEQATTILPDLQVDHDLLGQLAGKLAGDPAAPQPAELPAPPKPVGIHVSNDAMWVYLHIEGKRPYGLTVLNARELALALRQACNRVERGQR